MELSKIHFSLAETELMNNAGIILTKNIVLQKVKSLLEKVQQNQTAFVKKNNFLLETDLFSVAPKISKGENYLGLPYLILDYPRLSSSGTFFFIRTMFWWGNFFSSTLHISENSKNNFKEAIRLSYPALTSKYFIGINPDPWIHHFEEMNYKKISSLSKKEFDELCDEQNSIKIAAKWPLVNWPDAANDLYENWKFFLSICGLIS